MKVSKKLKQIVSVILLIAMVITMLPNGQLIKAADDGMNIDIHFYDKDAAYGGKVYLQYWQEGTATVSTEGEKFAAWDDVTRYPLSAEAEEGENWYGLNIKGSVEGFQFLNEDGTENTKGKGYQPGMKNYEGDLYYYEGKWYEENPVKNPNAEVKDLSVEPENVFYLVGSIADAEWEAKSKTYPLEKQTDTTYSITLENVPKGEYAFKVLQDPDNFSWDMAFGGSGSEGNYELTLTETSNVTITIDTTDEDRQIQVEIKSNKSYEFNENSPTYNEDGTVTFYYVAPTTQASIGVYGNLKTTQKKSVIQAEYAKKLAEEAYLYVATSAAIKTEGLYQYTFCHLNEDEEIVKELGDPLSKTKYASKGAFVRNPMVSNIGLITIFYPYDGEGAKVYYKKSTENDADTYAVGDHVTEEDATAKGYKAVKFELDEDFIGDGMYSAKFYDEEGTYSYVIVNAEGKVVKDKCNYNGNIITEKNVDKAALSVASPQVITNEDGSNSVKFMYYDSEIGSDATIYVAGVFNGWPGPDKGTEENQMVPDKDTPGIYALTLNDFIPGKYQYKVIVNGSWMADPLAPLKEGSDGNSVVVVPGLVPETGIEVAKGKSVTLPTTVQKYIKNTLTPETVEDVTYELVKKDQKGVTLENGVLSVAEDCEESKVPVCISDGKTSSVYNINVVDKMYQFTIHYYDEEDTSVYADRDLWIWEQAGKAYNTGYSFNGENFTDELGREWATATYEFPCNALNVIIRSKGEWSYQETTREMTIPEGATEGEFWLIKGNDLSADKWYENFPEKPKKWVIVEYERNNNDYGTWNLYTWTAQSKYKNKSLFFQEENGKHYVIFAVDQDTAKVEYLLRSKEPEDASWTGVEKDLSDRSIVIPKNQSVVKVKVKEGVAEPEYVPFNTGYELVPDQKQIRFYYRNDDVFALNQAQTTKIDKVAVNVNDQKIDMQYNSETDRFEGVLENLATGTYEYNYTITYKAENGTEEKTEIDKFNENKTEDGTKSVLTFEDLTSEVTASLNNTSMNYTQNRVLTVDYSNKEKVKPQSIYADLSALGGESKVAIDPALLKLTISVNDTIAVGEKEIPVKVVDQYNKTHATSVTINVTAKETATEEFDWDEAVIYFMLTDRFCDGNEANNDAYGVGDYDLENGSAYHGGDFAGVTSKLDYLKDLGINTIWITPIVENITTAMTAEGEVKSYGYAGYWASDFRKLNDHLGTEEEFKTLISEAHNRGIRIMVDVVLNHSGYGTESEEHFSGMYRENNIEGNDILGQQDGLPDFATENEEVRNTLIGWQTAWMKNYDIDYFRVDTVKHVESTTWSAFKNALTEISDKFKMIGECYGASYSDDAGYLQNGTLDSLLDFSFNDMADKFVTGDLSTVEKQLENRNTVLNSSATFGNFLGSHDEDGFAYKLTLKKDAETGKNYTLAKANALTKVAASLSITAKGQPIIYYGEEIGMSGANNYPKSENRYDMKFTDLTETEASTLDHYKRMLAIRKEYSKVFAKGTRKSITTNDEKKYMAFERSYNGTDVVVALNIADTKQEVTLNIPDFAGHEITNMYSGSVYKVAENGEVTVNIPSNKKGGTAVFVISDKKAGETLQPTVTSQPTESVQPTQTPGQPAVTSQPAVSAAPANTTPSVGTLQASVLGQAIANKVTVQFANATAVWTFDEKDLKLANAAKVSDIDLTCVVSNASIDANIKGILDKDANNEDGALVRFAHKDALPVDASVQVSLSTQNVIKPDTNVYIYRVSGKKLQQIAVNTAQVTSQGAVTLHLSKGGDYVVLANKPAKAVTKSLLDNVTVKYGKKTLKKGKTMKVTAKIANSDLIKVSNLKKTDKVQSAHLGVKITFKTTNKKIATVSSAGKVKAVKAGNCKIQTVVTLSNGQKKTVSQKLKVTGKKKTSKNKKKKATKKK